MVNEQRGWKTENPLTYVPWFGLFALFVATVALLAALAFGIFVLAVALIGVIEGEADGPSYGVLVGLSVTLVALLALISSSKQFAEDIEEVTVEPDSHRIVIERKRCFSGKIRKKREILFEELQSIKIECVCLGSSDGGPGRSWFQLTVKPTTGTAAGLFWDSFNARGKAVVEDRADALENYLRSDGLDVRRLPSDLTIWESLEDFFRRVACRLRGRAIG